MLLALTGLIVGCDNKSSAVEESEIQAIPIVETTQDLSVTLIGVEQHDDLLELTFRISDFEFGRSRLGYEKLNLDDIELVGLSWPEDDDVSVRLVAVVFQPDEHSSA